MTFRQLCPPLPTQGPSHYVEAEVQLSPSPQATPACGGLRRTDKSLQGLEVALELLMILPMCP